MFFLLFIIGQLPRDHSDIDMKVVVMVLDAATQHIPKPLPQACLYSQQTAVLRTSPVIVSIVNLKLRIFPVPCNGATGPVYVRYVYGSTRPVKAVQGVPIDISECP